MAGNKGKNRAEVQGDLVSVGSCIRENRKKWGFTQQQLASRIGVGHKTVSSWENGTREISLRSILKLCEVLFIDPNCLLQYKNKEDDFADLRSKLESMDERTKAAAVRSMDVLCDSFLEVSKHD